MTNTMENKKDISFLESEFLTFLLVTYFTNDYNIELPNNLFSYFPVKHIILASETGEEKVSIETGNMDSCDELYTALKSNKKVVCIDLLLKGKELEIGVTLKTNPLRITKVSAPKSIAEEEYDRIIERMLYVDIVFDCFDYWVKKFTEMRVRNGWNTLIEDFRNFLEKV